MFFNDSISAFNNLSISVLLSRVRMTFARFKTLCKSLAFASNPEILGPLNPLGSHRLSRGYQPILLKLTTTNREMIHP